MIKLQNITVKFNDQIVLNDVSLTVKKGEVVCVIGPSGSGKSTLIRTMNKLVEPTSGEVYFDNELVTNNNINSIRSKMTMVFQQFELFPHLTVLENIVLAPVSLKLMTKEEATKKAMDLLAMVNLQEKANSYPQSLSGGQKQRIAIVRSLALNPQAMLFDEPTSALDPEMVKEVLDVIKKLVETGMTIVIVTHEMNFAKEVADRIIFVDQHKILVDEAPDKFFSNVDNPRLKEFLSKIL